MFPVFFICLIAIRMPGRPCKFRCNVLGMRLVSRKPLCIVLLILYDDVRSQRDFEITLLTPLLAIVSSGIALVLVIPLQLLSKSHT